jgi:TfoX/Sxy family transcriptional regulator of competence genes
MPYDTELGERIRHVLRERSDVTERKMFGGLAFLSAGRMCCGILGGELIVRIADDELQAVMRRPHVRLVDFTGKPLKGFVLWRIQLVIVNPHQDDDDERDDRTM